MDTRLIDFFKVALVDSNTTLDPKVINQTAMKRGYIIHPDCCTDDVSIWLDDQDVNYNATFYKTWKDVTSKSRLELAIDQLISYAINYGLGGNFDMNDNDYSLVPDIRQYKVILPVTVEDLYNKCLKVLFSGIALKRDTMEALCDFIIKHRGEFAESGFTLDFAIDDIKNKEAQIYLCDQMGICPNEKFSLLRYIVYKVTSETQIVKDEYILQRMKIGRKFDLGTLSEKQLEGLASIFYRYKPVFLGLKSHPFPRQKYMVNRLRRMAKALHQPLDSGFWETIVNRPYTAFHLKDMIKRTNPSSFKLIRIIQAVREERSKIGVVGNVYSMYPIRNGKVWFKKEDVPAALSQKYDWWDILEEVLYKELVNRLKTKACTVKFPTELNLTCPTSEKTFIGNIPFGSNYKMTEHNMVGIYWREEWGARDFDLSFILYDGTRIGWNTDFKLGKKIIYSGDMTHANPEASEVLYMQGGCPDGMIKVNRYSGNEGSRFKLMVAQSKVDSLPENYMVDPNTIKFQTTIHSLGAESFVGFVNDGTLYMCDFQSGDSQVSSVMTSDEYGQVLARKARSFVDLKQLLLDAGFKERKRSTKDNPIELDLSDPNKDTLIDLFS